MHSSSRSIRQRLAIAALTVFSLFSLACSSLVAQETIPGDAPAAEAAESVTTEPVAVITLGSVNKLKNDLNYLFGLSGRNDLAFQFAFTLEMFTKGIDATQPIGVLVPLVDGVPQPLLIVSTPDLKRMLTPEDPSVPMPFGPVDELEDGSLAFSMAGKLIFARQRGSWAILSQERTLLDLAPADPNSLFEGLGNKYDLAVRFRMQEIPAQIRQNWTDSIRQGFSQAMASQSGEEAEAARKVAENSLEQINQLIEETDELKLGFNVDTTGKKVVVDTMFSAVPGSKLASIYGAQRPIPSQFSSVIRPDAAAFYHGATSISPEAIDQYRTSVSNAISTVRNQLKSEARLTEEQQQEIFAMVDRIGELAMDSISEGRADVGALLLADESDFRFVLGTFVADGNRAAQIVKELATKVENEPNAPRFSFDQSNYKGVNLHVVEADVQEDDEELRRIFGDTLRIHLGTGEKSVYLSFGKNSESLMKELIDAGGTDSGAGRPVGQFRLTLMPILQYAQSIKSNDTLMVMIDALSRESETDEFSVVQESVQNGQAVTVNIGEALLRAIGAASRQIQQNAIQANPL